MQSSHDDNDVYYSPVSLNEDSDQYLSATSDFKSSDSTQPYKKEELVIPISKFARLVKTILQSHGDYRVTNLALEALQEASEMYLVDLFEDAFRCTRFRSRVTLRPEDIELVCYIRGYWYPINSADRTRIE
ncbi:uncharacterized protein LOC132261646 [Phlebotomus argentipes]|uniref:uncharacterized protein LOC132261646 n=1 Tax=Phlebotomus argentipes TaxID=94469 RepID=UPI002892C703|nr:uncharacterized protein LOC132261646 [Phlebotomus argentipes]